MMTQFDSAMSVLLASLSALVLYSALAVTPAQATTFETDRYRMLVISDQDSGSDLLAGRYTETIDTLTRTRLRSDRFSASINLCVAYVRIKETSKALKACKKAVDRSRRKSRRNQAIALSNLGVVRALIGDLEAARHSFKAAIRLHARLGAPNENLTRLELKS